MRRCFCPPSIPLLYSISFSSIDSFFPFILFEWRLSPSNGGGCGQRTGSARWSEGNTMRGMRQPEQKTLDEQRVHNAWRTMGRGSTVHDTRYFCLDMLELVGLVGAVQINTKAIDHWCWHGGSANQVDHPWYEDDDVFLSLWRCQQQTFGSASSNWYLLGCDIP